MRATIHSFKGCLVVASSADSCNIGIGPIFVYTSVVGGGLCDGGRVRLLCRGRNDITGRGVMAAAATGAPGSRHVARGIATG